ncbi:Glycosyltransferase involved in cell wall bisynthesis [Verrucomicrobium sp. GAS474]|uniref:glycosyltransferase family 4 protein n=1 Tax=Verrucomicrobium sp. GAS474 TaxID=1882831 RepID=UPI00087AAB78|nr:glycosyltransferase family 4 protein [Verrucomicrobium sp. GAS474]SDU01691.1 Glycosyltransferase involved in cell wall bisynthesis [Verrucomicrobium sp. GAS474]
MKLLLVEYRDWKNPRAGGAERALREIFSRLADPAGPWKWEVDYLCTAFPGAPAEERSDHLGLIRRGSEALFTLNVARHVNRHGRDYDLVVEGIDKLPFFLPWFFPKLPVAAIVPHLLGETAFSAAGLLGGTLIRIGEALLPFAYRKTPLLPISASTRDELVERGLPRQNLRVVLYGHATEAQTPGDARPCDPATFLYVGRLRRYKSLDVVLRAFAQVVERRPEARLVLAGAGDDRARLEALVLKLGLGTLVRFPGAVSEKEKSALMRRATALVYPSRKEGWGLSVIEAGACGTPTLAADVPGLRDAVDDGKSGLLLPWGDVPAWAAAMERLIADPAGRERLAQGAAARAGALSWEDSARTMAGELEGVVKGG